MLPSWPHSAGKQLMDVVGAFFGLVLLAPFTVIIGGLIFMTSPGSVLIFQNRSGLRGQLFKLLKFRSMHGEENIQVGQETQADDPRIFPVGSWLRRTGIDEVPQLINVLLGQMSLVGPRPLVPRENEQCNQRQERRLLVKPGLTGLSIVNGRNAIPWDERVEWDIRYVEKASFWLDCLILLHTIPMVLFGRNAYPNNETDTTCRMNMKHEAQANSSITKQEAKSN